MRTATTPSGNPAGAAALGGVIMQPRESDAEPGRLIFPLVAEPGRTGRPWGRFVAAGVVVGVLMVAVVAVLALLRDPDSLRWLTTAPGPVAQQAESPLPGHAPAGERFGRPAAGVFELAPGTCLRDVVHDGRVRDVAVVPCHVEHQAEVVAAVAMPDGPWPGAERVAAFADGRCVTAIRAAGLDSREDLLWSYYAPTRFSWTSRNDRMISCLIVTSDGAMTGSLVPDGAG